MFRLFLATLIIGIFGSAQPGAGDRGPQMVLDLLRNGNGSMVFLMCDNAVRSAVMGRARIPNGKILLKRRMARP